MARTKLTKFCAAIVWQLALTAPASALNSFSQPSWSELSIEQKTVLAPLVNDWDELEPYRKKKWLGIAQRFGTLAPEEKARVQTRMKEWARLSPAERKAARDSFTSMRKAPAEHHGIMKETIRQKWQEYSELPEDEKKQLRSEANGKNVPLRRPTSIQAR